MSTPSVARCVLDARAVHRRCRPSALVGAVPAQPAHAAGLSHHRRSVLGHRRRSAPAETVSSQVTGRGGVPATGVGAVALNVTVTNTTAPSFLTVFPTGSRVAARAPTSTSPPARRCPTWSSARSATAGACRCSTSVATSMSSSTCSAGCPTGAAYTAITPERVLDSTRRRADQRRAVLGCRADRLGRRADVADRRPRRRCRHRPSRWSSTSPSPTPPCRRTCRCGPPATRGPRPPT